MEGCRRCSLCAIDYPRSMAKCRVCGGETDYCANVKPNPDWQRDVELAKYRGTEDSPGEVKFIYETGPDGVARMFITTADFVRARLATSAMSLRLLAQTDPTQETGLPVLDVNGLRVELQGYDHRRRRWWVELLDEPVIPGEAVSL